MVALARYRPAVRFGLRIGFLLRHPGPRLKAPTLGDPGSILYFSLPHL